MHNSKTFAMWWLASLLAIYFFGLCESQAQMNREKILKGHPVVVIIDSLSSRNLEVNSQVAARIREIVKSKSQAETYVYEGEEVWAKVRSLKKPGIYGKKAEVIISIDSTKSTGKTTIPLSGERKLKGKGKGILPYLLFPIGWLFKGSYVEKDTCVVSAKVSKDTYIYVAP